MKWLLCFLWIGTSIAIYAQTETPIWVHDVYRRINYPPEQWHTGFVQDQLKANEDASTKLKTMERDAINRLAESIIVTIEGETQVESGSNNSETNAAGFRQKVKTVTSATLVNLDVNSYYDPSTGMLYAFAAIKRSDLSNYYQKQIVMDISQAETAIESLKQYIAAGKKSSARSKIKETNRMLDEVSFYRTMLHVANTDTSSNALKPGREDELHRTLEKILVGYNMDIIVYMDCQLERKDSINDALKNVPDILCGIIAQALNENGCTITDDIRKADFVLTLIGSTTQRSDGSDSFGIISYYANAKGSLYDRSEQKKLAEFNILNDRNVYAAGKSPEDAVIKAFKLPVLKNMIMEKILSAINN